MVSALAVALAVLAALLATPVRAQQARDPLIDPPSGGAGSRFQVVGQSGWTPGETVTISIAFSTAPEPLSYSGMFPYAAQVTVLRDGTWSFPVVLNETVLGAPLPSLPGYVIVRAESGLHVAVNAYVYTLDGRRPAGADAIAPLGFGMPPPDPTFAVTVAMFAVGIGGLFAAAGLLRRRETVPRISQIARIEICGW